MANRIGVVGFSSTISPELFSSAKAFLSEKGYELVAPFDPSQEHGTGKHLFSAASVKTRIAAFNELLLDRSIKAIFSARGAYGSMELLEHLDYSLYSKNPLPVIGLSDTTALLLALSSKASRARCVHGPSILTGFAKAKTSKAATQSSEAILSYIEGSYSFPKQNLEFFAGQKMATAISGPIIGGNLSLLASLMGTPWQADFEGKIVFLEEIGESPYRVHRMLLQLQLGGCFKKVKAVLLGDFLECVHPKGLGPNVDQALKEIFSTPSFPVLNGLACGHGDLNLPMPLAATAKISTNLEFQIYEKS